jgi:hypothetical protein
LALLGWQKKNGPDLEGIWHGSGWGSVQLERTGPGAFQGTYTSTYGKDVGRISLSWNPGAGRYEGTWGEGAYRHGRVWVRPDERAAEFSGAFSADPDCEHRPGDPASFEFRWTRNPGAGSEPFQARWVGFRDSAGARWVNLPRGN